MNFNEEGVHYAYRGTRAQLRPLGCLSEECVLAYAALQSAARICRNEKIRSEQLTSSVVGVLHHFEVFNFQMERITSHIDKIARTGFDEHDQSYMVQWLFEPTTDGSPPSRYMLTISAAPFEYDFVLFMLSAVALLDRLANALVEEFSLSCGNGFFRVSKELSFIADARASIIVENIEKVHEKIVGLLVSDGSISLRNKIDHRKSMTDLIGAALTVHRFEDGYELIVDHEVDGYPLFGSAGNILEGVCRIVINTLITLLKSDSNGLEHERLEFLRYPAEDAFISGWKNPTVHAPEYISTHPDALVLTVVKPGPDSSRLVNIRVDPKIYEKKRLSQA